MTTTTTKPVFATIRSTLGRVSVDKIIEAMDAWVQGNLRIWNHGFSCLEINGHEIYWLSYSETSRQFKVLAGAGPLLRLGIRHGTESPIVCGYVDGLIEPIFSAKVWTLDAAEQLMGALSRASFDCLDG